MSVRGALSPLLLAAADLYFGSLLYLHVSALLGLLLLVCGLSVLLTVAWDPLNLVVSTLRRHLPEGTTK